VKAIFKKYPQLVSIGDALDAYREMLPITTGCLSSSQILKVTEVVATGTLWI
jgi:hypothetical protein